MKAVEGVPITDTIAAKASSPPKIVESEIKDGKAIIGIARETKEEFEKALVETLGVADSDLQNHLLAQGLSAFHTTDDNEFLRATNIVIALMHEINPKNGTEGLLATQMIHTHHLAIEMMRRATGKQQSIESVDRNINMAAKLTRVFNQQIETLQKMRGKGQQKITVEHVNVNEGGQAIVGDVNYQGGGK